MSRLRDELLDIRSKLLVGDPPYKKDALGAKTRTEGTRGLDERRDLGDYSQDASGIRLALESQLRLLEILLERWK